MKKFALNIFIVSGLAFLASCASPQYVTYRPAPVTVVRPGPYAASVWVGPQYRYQNHRYITVPGHYVRQRPHHIRQKNYRHHGPHSHYRSKSHWKRH